MWEAEKIQTKFKMTENHLKLLRGMFVHWNSSETGAPEVDPKRPYGNSYVPEDVADIIGFKYNKNKGLTTAQEEELLDLHRETELALQIALSTGQFKVGTYKKLDEYDDTSWVPQQ